MLLKIILELYFNYIMCRFNYKFNINIINLLVDFYMEKQGRKIREK